MKRPNEKGAAPAANGRSASSKQSVSNTEASAEQPSWRSFYEPHPAALVFHRYTTAEDRRRIKKGLKEAERLEIRIVTAHVADESGGKTYVVDGITRLEEMEKLGWQIVDEHGNWIGKLEGMVHHHRNYTHEQVRKLVASLNGARRHMTQQDVSDAIVETLKLEMEGQLQSLHDEPIEFLSIAAEKIEKRGRGRPKDAFKTEALKRAAAEGIGPAVVERSLGKQPDRPKIKKSKREAKGKLLNGEPASEVFDPAQFKETVLKPVKKLLKNVDHKRIAQAKHVIVDEFFNLHHREKGEWVSPTHLVYPDGTQFTVDEVLKEGFRLRLKSDKRKKLEPSGPSVDLTAAFGHAPREQKGGAK